MILLRSLHLKSYLRFQNDGIMINFLTLDKKGVALAFLFGVMLLFFGGGYGPFFLFDMILFLVLSAIATWRGRLEKEGMGMYESSRGWKNVLANGLVPVMMSVLLFADHSSTIPRLFVAIAYVASVAAIAADKFASEIGVLDGTPTMLLTMKRVKKGMSGGVTVLGLAASAVASLAVGLSVLYITGSFMTVILVTLAGFFGNLIDSVFGYYEEKGIGNKYTSNFMCSLAGAVVCILALTYL